MNIPDELFCGCNLLTNVDLPDSVVKIAGSAFVFTSLDSLTARGFTTTGSLFMHLGKVVRYLGEPKSVVIPSTVREIGENAFARLYSLVDLRFEEGVERIYFSAFSQCYQLTVVTFPASLVVIDERAFYLCRSLREVTFAADSKLQHIGKEAFPQCPLEKVFLPASVTEIDPSAFFPDTWRMVTFEGPPLLLVNGDFLCSPDSRTMLKFIGWQYEVEVPAHIEVIGRNAVEQCDLDTVTFASGSRLREIGEEAFSHCSGFTALSIPSSVEILGDRCFENCGEVTTITFEAPSKVKKIGERAFAFSSIQSFTIPALTNEMDGSAFAGCPLEEIDIDPGNQRFILGENILLTPDGTEIVRCFGLEREILVPMEVEVLQKSCCESLRRLTELKFESGSKLRRICRSALSDCESLRNIVVPASVTEIEEFAFKGCFGLEECSIHKDAVLTAIGQEAFAGCSCLRSFYVPKNVEGIGKNCFWNCPSLLRLKFGSGDTLRSIVGDRTLDEAFGHLGFSEIRSLVRIEVEDDDSDLPFPGWVSVADASSHLTLTRKF
jgi:hypothetical protein